MSQYPTTLISEPRIAPHIPTTSISAPPSGIAPHLTSTSINAPRTAKFPSPGGTKDPAIVAAAIERAGIILLRDRLGCYYTIAPRKGLYHLSAERLLSWLPKHTGLSLTPDTPATARRILDSAELAAISTPCEPRLPLTPSQLEDLVRAIYNKL